MSKKSSRLVPTKGRPLIGDEMRERISITLSPKTIKSLDRASRRMKVSRSSFVEGILQNLDDARMPQVQVPKAKILEICRAYGVKSLSLFGSVLSSSFSKESDIDILVEFRKENVPDLFKLSEIKLAIEEAFKGRKVDLRTYDELSPRFRGEVTQNLYPLYIS